MTEPSPAAKSENGRQMQPTEQDSMLRRLATWISASLRHGLMAGTVLDVFDCDQGRFESSRKRALGWSSRESQDGGCLQIQLFSGPPDSATSWPWASRIRNGVMTVQVRRIQARKRGRRGNHIEVDGRSRKNECSGHVLGLIPDPTMGENWPSFARARRAGTNSLQRLGCESVW